MALTLDGFLPHEDEMLMRWVRENKRYGFPRWQRQATFHIYPHYGLMDLLNVKEKHDKDCIYLAGVGDGGSAEYADGLFRYNLVWPDFPDRSRKLAAIECWADPISLAATFGISVDFFS